MSKLTPDQVTRLEAAKTTVTDAMKAAQEQHNLSAEELLVLFAFMTGGICAAQDKETMSPQRAIKVVGAAFQEGNRVAAEMIEAGFTDEGGRS